MAPIIGLTGLQVEPYMDPNMELQSLAARPGRRRLTWTSKRAKIMAKSIILGSFWMSRYLGGGLSRPPPDPMKSWSQRLCGCELEQLAQRVHVR